MGFEEIPDSEWKLHREHYDWFKTDYYNHLTSTYGMVEQSKQSRSES